MIRRWTQTDAEMLAKMIADGAMFEKYQAAFPDRSFESLKLKARRMGLRLSCKCHCGRTASVKDNLCSFCRNEHILVAYRNKIRIPWKPEFDDELMRLKNARSRSEWTAILRHVSELTNAPITTVKMHCARLNLFWFRRPGRARPWTPAEEETLRELASSRTLKHIATVLKRSLGAISCRIHTLGLSQRVISGYSQKDLSEVFGVSGGMVRKWVARGWLGPRLDWDSEHHRIPDSVVREFITNHPEQYDLRRVDDAWFKGMMFPTFGTLRDKRQTKSNQLGAIQ